MPIMFKNDPASGAMVVRMGKSMGRGVVVVVVVVLANCCWICCSCAFLAFILSKISEPNCSSATDWITSYLTLFSVAMAWRTLSFSVMGRSSRLGGCCCCCGGGGGP